MEVCLIWMRSESQQGGQEGRVYSSVIFYYGILFYLGEECV